jgi:hypothetical protein
MTSITRNCPFCGITRKDDKTKAIEINGDFYGNKLFWHFYSPECVNNHYAELNGKFSEEFEKVCEYAKTFYTRQFAKNEAKGRKTDAQLKIENETGYRFCRLMIESGKDAVPRIAEMIEFERMNGKPRKNRNSPSASATDSDTASESEMRVRVPKKTLAPKKKATAMGGKPYGNPQTREMATQTCEEDTMTEQELGEKWERLYGETATEEMRVAYKPGHFDLTSHLLAKEAKEPETPRLELTETFNFAEESETEKSETEETPMKLTIKKKAKKLRVVAETESD